MVHMLCTTALGTLLLGSNPLIADMRYIYPVNRALVLTGINTRVNKREK